MPRPLANVAVIRPVLFVCATLVASGCASTLSTLQTATPMKRGQVAVTGGAGVYFNAGPAVTIVQQGIEQGTAIKQAADSGEPYAVSEEAQQQLLTAAIALAVMPPSQGYELSIRTGILPEDLDAGFRYSVNAVRLDAKYRFLHKGDGVDTAPHRRRSLDLAVGLGVSKYMFDNPVLDALGYVNLAEFSRWDLEVPVYASMDLGDIFKAYSAVKYVYSRTELDANLVNYSQQATNISGLDMSLPSDVDTHFVGATIGAAAGYRWAHLFVELTGGYTFCDPILFGRRRSLGGPTIYPAVGLGLKFP